MRTSFSYPLVVFQIRPLAHTGNTAFFDARKSASDHHSSTERFQKRALKVLETNPVSTKTARRVSDILDSEPRHLSLQRIAMTPNQSATYVRDARKSVVGRFEKILASRNGTTWAHDGKYWTIFSPDGEQQTVVDLGDGAQPELFQDGIALFWRNEKVGMVTNTGEVIADALFDEIRPFEGNYAAVQQNGLWGALDYQGHQKVSCLFANEDALRKVLGRMSQNVVDS